MWFERPGLPRGRSMRSPWAEMIREVPMKGGGLNGLVAVERWRGPWRSCS